ncbi:MAG: N-acetylmuramoyl-L-alanine amidase [Patescibacteria group bacterium]
MNANEGQKGAWYTVFVMNRALFLLLVSFCGSAVAVGFSVSVSREFSFADVRDLAASVFFVDSVTADGLKQKYARAAQGGGKVRILIVPGHDNGSSGAEFRGVHEAEMTAAVGEELSRLLSSDRRYAPTLARTRADYAKEFRDYFTVERDSVRAFVANKRQVMKDLRNASMVRREQGVAHNAAPSDVVWKLYSFNRWANENKIDIVLHLHFNDYPGRSSHRPGRYEGFALYVPETQFSNARASAALAKSLFAQFARFYAESNFPLEESGIVPDQDLIAVGAYNTLDSAAVLIEYGYIYEQRFLDAAIREKHMKELAFQTHLGLNRFFGAFEEALRKYPTTFLPHEWSTPLGEGARNQPSVLSLQAALLLEELYPPEGDKRACPLTGSFGHCTRRALVAFQQKHGIAPASGAVDVGTRAKLNELYGR